MIYIQNNESIKNSESHWLRKDLYLFFYSLGFQNNDCKPCACPKPKKKNPIQYRINADSF